MYSNFKLIIQIIVVATKNKVLANQLQTTCLSCVRTHHTVFNQDLSWYCVFDITQFGIETLFQKTSTHRSRLSVSVDLIKWKKISSQKMFQALYNLKMDLLCLSTKNSELNGGMGWGWQRQPFLGAIWVSVKLLHCMLYVPKWHFWYTNTSLLSLTWKKWECTQIVLLWRP